MAVLGLRFCARAFSSCSKWGPLFIAVCRPLTIAASPVAEHRLQMRRLSNCGSWTQLLRGTWDLPRPGLEPVCPALAGRLSTSAPPGKHPGGSFKPSLLFGKRMPSTVQNDLVIGWKLRAKIQFFCSKLHVFFFPASHDSFFPCWGN